MLLFNYPKKKVKKQKKQYKKIVLKLSLQQMLSLESYCKANDISVNKFIKKSISHVTNAKHHMKPQKEVCHTKQTDLEDLINLMDKELETGSPKSEDGNANS